MTAIAGIGIGEEPLLHQRPVRDPEDEMPDLRVDSLERHSVSGRREIGETIANGVVVRLVPGGHDLASQVEGLAHHCGVSGAKHERSSPDRLALDGDVVRSLEESDDPYELLFLDVGGPRELARDAVAGAGAAMTRAMSLNASPR